MDEICSMNKMDGIYTLLIVFFYSQVDEGLQKNTTGYTEIRLYLLKYFSLLFN